MFQSKEVRPSLISNREQVGKSFRNEQGHFAALSLEEGIGAASRSEAEVHIRERSIELGAGEKTRAENRSCLLYTSDAADD
mgnify:CR=1 FL=1